MTTKIHTTYIERWQKLAAKLRQASLSVWLQPISDEFQGEYPAAYAQRLSWLSGFTGSAGVGAITSDGNAHLFVDGRYTVQARQEVPEAMEVYVTSELTLIDWLKKQPKGVAVAFDRWLHTTGELARFEKQLPDISFHSSVNFVDQLWEKQPNIPNEPLKLHDIALAGQESNEKIAFCQNWLKDNGCDALFISAPDAVMWMLNIRGADIPYNPLALSYAMVMNNGDIQLFMQPRELCDRVKDYLFNMRVTQHDINLLWSGKHNPFIGIECCAIDSGSAPYALKYFAEQANCSLKEAADPIIAAKAVKNSSELHAIRTAHHRDALAVNKFLHWFYAQDTVNELQAIEVLEAFRKQDKTYRHASFPTIAGAGANGAIVHYRANKQSNHILEAGELFLVDSGGQYEGGTTDVTRTMVFGTPSKEQCEFYTRVLKGHIALSRARFPKGITGSQLDPLARQPLWHVGADYAHGTGHGVGASLCVHEGPQHISKRSSNVALVPGMILSNEPGYYKEGAYGIRIENLIEITECGEGLYGSEPLTLVPYDKRLMDLTLLDVNEREWINAYHSKVYQAMQAAKADAELLLWLSEETKDI